MAPGETVALPWCPAPLPPPTCLTWRRTPGSCGDEASMSGRRCARRRRSSLRWGWCTRLPVKWPPSLVHTYLRAYWNTTALTAYWDTFDLGTEDEVKALVGVKYIFDNCLFDKKKKKKGAGAPTALFLDGALNCIRRLNSSRLVIVCKTCAFVLSSGPNVTMVLSVWMFTWSRNNFSGYLCPWWPCGVVIELVI